MSAPRMHCNMEIHFFFYQDVSIWNQVYSMRMENRVMGNWELKVNGFAKIKLMKSIMGLF